MVAVNQNVDDVKEFGVYTEDHKAMITWLKEHSITTIAFFITIHFNSYKKLSGNVSNY